MKFPAAVLTFSLLVTGPALAQAPSPTAAREIAQLFSALQTSGCAFSRNGSWYDAGEATDHLHQKYDYLLKKGLVTTPESFIERAATRSSMTGKPYLVRCKGSEPVPSGAWLTGRLKELRGRATG